MRWVVIGLLAALVAAPSSPGAATDSVDATKRVVREWSARVNAYDNDGVARLFARPAAVAQGGTIYALRTYEEIALWHRGLPCAARIVSITVKGQDATAVFVLRNGPHRRCDAPGGKVAAVFRITGGKIRAVPAQSWAMTRATLAGSSAAMEKWKIIYCPLRQRHLDEAVSLMCYKL